MAKKHLFSVHNDFKTGFFYKFFLILGCILFIIYFVETLLHLIGLSDDSIGIILAFAILSLGLGLILYFFSRQFTKLSQIAEEVEQNESLGDEEEIKEQT
jgi:Zn-dependent protease with chaperone function